VRIPTLKGTLAAVAAAALCLLLPGMAFAQDCQPCDSPGGDDHHFHSWGCSEGGYCYSCTLGKPGNNGCHTGTSPDGCDDWHLHCSATVAPIAEVIDAYSAGDVDTLVTALVDGGDFYSLNQTRSAIQASNCAGDIVANLPLSDEEFNALALRVAVEGATSAPARE